VRIGLFVCLCMAGAAPLILTLAMDRRSFAFLDGQRRRYFPAERNVIPAHVTLFHALPGAELDNVCRDLAEVSRDQELIALRLAGLRSLGRGVAYMVASPELAALRTRLAERWLPWLTRQDRQPYRPHVTVQNKVDPAIARTTLSELEASFTPVPVVGEGLELWHYRGGPWHKAATSRFGPAT
jgi:2'-5' RNA ligase